MSLDFTELSLAIRLLVPLAHAHLLDAVRVVLRRTTSDTTDSGHRGGPQSCGAVEIAATRVGQLRIGRPG